MLHGLESLPIPAHAALTIYTYFLRSILTPIMQKIPLRACRRIPRATVVLCTGFATRAQARQPSTPNRVHLPLGLLLRSRLFPTQPRGYAVTLRFTSVSRFGGDQIFTDWIVCSHDHTGRGASSHRIECSDALTHTTLVRTETVRRYPMHNLFK